MLEEDFLEAIVKGDSQRVVRLLGQISDTGPIKDGRNALHIAAQYGNADIVSVLLLSGLYDCKTTDSIGYTALHFAAAEGYLEIVKQLIKSGSDVNAADNVHGNTALHDAAWKGYSRTVTELAKSKANLNVKNCGGFTPLHLSCQNGHNQSCRELLLAGCDPDVQNNYGDTPLHTSARYGHAGVMRILISAQCHVSDQNKNGDTALHIAAAMNRRKLTRILLESNCNKQAVNKQNETAEDIAIRKSHAEILEILRNPAPRPKKSVKVVETAAPAVTALTKQAESKRAAHSKKSTKAKKATEVAPTTAASSSAPWSPYGCHYHPDSAEFPEPRLDSLPPEPLRKGEQYYLDLAGNIRKGPVGVGYTCYCAPMFHELENRIEKKTKKIKKQIHRAEDAINKRLNTLEYCLGNQQEPTAHTSDFRAEYCSNQYSNAPHSPLSHTRSLESVFDRKNGSKHDGGDEDDDATKKSSNYSEKRKNILFLKNNVAAGSQHPYNSSLHTCFPVESDDTSLSIERCRGKLYSSASSKGCSKASLWKSSRLDADSCDSSDEDCEKIADIPCNDSGYSTKMCSNSQGPSPSLSGRLENDGLLSITPSQEEKRTVEMTTFMSTFKNMSLKQASVV